MTDRGFTLIEVLVALALLAGTMAALMPVFGESLNRSADSTAEREAVALAQSVLARAGREWPLIPARRDGVDPDGHRWQLAISRDPRGDPGAALNLFRVSVRVVWPGAWRERSLELVTLRTAPRG